MVKKIFRLINENGKLVREEKINVPSTWEDITLRNYINYINVLKNWDKFNEEINSVKGTPDYEEKEIQNAVFMMDSLIALTGIDPILLQTMSVRDLLDFQSGLSFWMDDMPSGMEKDFFFRSASIKEIEKSKRALKATSLMNVAKRAKIKAQLKLMENSHFTMKESYGDMSLKSHIGVNRIVKEINQIKKETEKMEFDRLPLLIAYCVDMNGEKLNIKKAKKLGDVFMDLPFPTVIKISNFFLNCTKVFSSGTKIYSAISSYLQKTNQKHLRKKTT